MCPQPHRHTLAHRHTHTHTDMHTFQNPSQKQRACTPAKQSPLVPHMSQPWLAAPPCDLVKDLLGLEHHSVTSSRPPRSQAPFCDLVKDLPGLKHLSVTSSRTSPVSSTIVRRPSQLSSRYAWKTSDVGPARHAAGRLKLKSTPLSIFRHRSHPSTSKLRGSHGRI